MAFELSFEPAALRALDEIERYLAERSPAGAKNVLADIRVSLNLLSRFGSMGISVEATPFRMVISPKYKYRLIIAPEQRRVRIIQIFHPSQKLPFEPT